MQFNPVQPFNPPVHRFQPVGEGPRTATGRSPATAVRSPPT